MSGPDQGYSGRYRDDISGQVLKDEWVVAARLKELEFFAAKACGSRRLRPRRDGAQDGILSR